MLSGAMIEHGSPTLAGLKTGNIFTVKEEKDELRSQIRSMNQLLVRKGLRIIPLKKVKNGTIVYLYRPEDLRGDLLCPEAASILEEKGYPCGNPNLCVVELMRRLGGQEEFPHEIGLFLGYPPADVRGFMNSPREGVVCSGCWKAYGNPQEAEKTFRKYKKCTAVYRQETEKGRPLERLIVDNRPGRAARSEAH